MQYNESGIGVIEVICGPMYAGKTEELIRRTKRMEYAKKNFLIFKPNIDNRYATDFVVSHNKKSMEAINIDINHPEQIIAYVTEEIQSIVIDEVQFFDERLLEIVKHFADKGMRVICAGLDMDFKGEPFGLIPNLLAMAESVTKLTAICNCCGEEATRTQRLVDGRPAYDDDPIVLVGATESYEARCRKCHQVLHHHE